MSRRNLEEEILQVVSDKTGVPTHRLALQDRLLQDLKIDGDDAADLLINLATAHRVDMSGLDFTKHFRPEPNLLSILRKSSTKKRELAQKVPVTIKDLVQAVYAGKWKT
jgi:hypothetical protein